MVSCLTRGCRYYLRSKDGGLVKKPWGIITSSPQIAAQLDDGRCQGCHPHVPAAGQETARTARYPVELCRRIHTLLDDGEKARLAAKAMTKPASPNSSRDAEMRAQRADNTAVDAGTA